MSALGIDLGTTYSCVAYVDEFGRPQVLPNIEDELTTPSVVFFDGSEAIIGQQAKNMRVAEPDQTIDLIKRHMTIDESFEKKNKFPLNLDPSEISAEILKKLVADANAALDREDDPIKDVVITVPAYFSGTAKARTRQAGELAGLNVLQIINEPTAAALSYGVTNAQEAQNILVYDLGGGTFDVTILEVCCGDFRALGTKGDPLLGGADWDMRLAKQILDKYNRQYNTKYVMPETREELLNASSETKKMYYSLMNEAERVKKALTASRKGTASTAWLFEDDGHSLARTEITREMFDSITADLLSRTISITRAAVEKAKNPRIDTIVMVGGSTFMPQVAARLQAEFSVPIISHEPAYAVAKGAAILAHLLKNPNKKLNIKNIGPTKISVQDVCSKSYGIGINEDEVFNLIYANTPLPATASSSFSTLYDKQTSIALQVYESDSMDQTILRDFAEPVGDQGEICFGRPVHKGYPVTECFTIDKNGILTVTAWSEEGASIEFKVRITGIKSEDEMRRAKNFLDNIKIN